MSLIEKAILQISRSATPACSATERPIDVRIQLLVVVAYIAVVLSIPMSDPASLLWMFCFPIIMAEAMGLGYGSLLRRSLWILPLLAVIGIFNPILDREVVWHAGSIAINRGWLTFASLMLRGLLAYQGLLLLIGGYGFYDVCRTLQFYHIPKALVTQLMMLYRYTDVLLREALTMQRSIQSRGFGRKSFPLKLWGTVAGQLLMRSVKRARRVHDAMVSRGFSGIYRFSPFAISPRFSDYAYLVLWLVVFITLRLVDFTTLIAPLLRCGL